VNESKLLLGVENEGKKSILGDHVREYFGHTKEDQNSVKEKPKRIKGSPACAPQVHRIQRLLPLKPVAKAFSFFTVHFFLNKPRKSRISILNSQEGFLQDKK